MREKKKYARCPACHYILEGRIEGFSRLTIYEFKGKSFLETSRAVPVAGYSDFGVIFCNGPESHKYTFEELEKIINSQRVCKICNIKLPTDAFERGRKICKACVNLQRRVKRYELRGNLRYGKKADFLESKKEVF